MAMDNEPKGLQRRRRRVRSDGVIEEWSAAMGLVLTIPAHPRPRKGNVSVDAEGWERVRTFYAERRGGR